MGAATDGQRKAEVRESSMTIPGFLAHHDGGPFRRCQQKKELDE
jgi:hypothetical protein